MIRENKIQIQEHKDRSNNRKNGMKIKSRRYKYRENVRNKKNKNQEDKNRERKKESNFFRRRCN